MTLVLAAIGGDSNATLTPPAAVTGLLLEPADAGVAVSWTAPQTAPGVAPVTAYNITATTPDGLLRMYSIPATATTADLAQLSNDVTWTIVIVAASASGDSPAIAGTVVPTATAPELANPVQPITDLPSAPALVSVDAGAYGAVATWTPPVDSGGAPLQSYLVSAVAPDGSVITVGIAATPDAATEYAVIAPLVNGIDYDVSVAAINAIGVGPASNVLTVTPLETAADVGGGTPSTPVYVPPPQPQVEAFPVSYPMSPSFFLKTPDEAAAILAGTGVSA